MLAWGESHFGPRDFVCMISPDNTSSLRLAAKLGYREYARTTYKGDASVLLRREGLGTRDQGLGTRD